MYLVISNEGVVEKEAFSLVGASTKRGDSGTIGQFGSGNKYALCYLLRNNIPVHIFSDGKEIPVEVVDTEFRDEVFGVIHIDGQPTSLTTEMGGCDWKLWQAIREIYCNALDEGEVDPLCVTHDPSPFTCTGRTAIVIDYTDEVKDMMTNFHLYFCKDTKVVYEDGVGRMLEKKSPDGELRIFRKGILVSVIKTEEEALFDYDLNDIHINESRVADYSWQTPESILQMFFNCEDKHLIQQFLTKDCYEMSCGDEGMVTVPTFLSESWGTFLSQMTLATNAIYTFMHNRVSGKELSRCRIVPEYFLKAAVSSFPETAVLGQSLSSDGSYVPLKATQEMVQAVMKTLQHLKGAGIHVNYPIEVVEFNDSKIMGRALPEDKKILLSDKVFHKGEQYLMETILEEYVHLCYDVEDETRHMQDVLLMLLCQNILREGFNKLSKSF